MEVRQPTIRWAAEPGDMHGALAVREEVFCREQGVSVEEELDGRDEQALHLVALADGEVIATLRLLRDGATAKIGRVAVLRPWRRRGLASELLQAALARARADGAGRARLAAQLDAIELYRRAGFAVESEPFEEAGITHVWMGRAL